jgi:hypothetical protein
MPCRLEFIRATSEVFIVASFTARSARSISTRHLDPDRRRGSIHLTHPYLIADRRRGFNEEDSMGSSGTTPIRCHLESDSGE